MDRILFLGDENALTNRNATGGVDHTVQNINIAITGAGASHSDG